MKEVIYNNISASIKLDDPQIHYNNSSFSNAFNTGLILFMIILFMYVFSNDLQKQSYLFFLVINQ